jgi:predicted DNA-binding antitoxin AbrB/MazE fold protein
VGNDWEEEAMSKVLQATYHDGKLSLDEKLDTALEGRKLRIIVLGDVVKAEDEGDQVLEPRKQRFLEQLQQHSFTLPEDYKFNREDLYER